MQAGYPVVHVHCSGMQFDKTFSEIILLANLTVKLSDIQVKGIQLNLASSVSVASFQNIFFNQALITNNSQGK